MGRKDPPIRIVDKRLIDRNVSNGRISRTEVEDHLKGLPDLQDQADNIADIVYAIDSAADGGAADGSAAGSSAADSSAADSSAADSSPAADNSAADDAAHAAEPASAGALPADPASNGETPH